MPLKFEVSTRSVRAELTKQLRAEAKEASEKGKVTAEGLSDASDLLGAAATRVGGGKPVEVDRVIDEAMAMTGRIWAKFNKQTPQTLNAEELEAMSSAKGERTRQVQRATSDAMVNAFTKAKYPSGTWDELAEDHPLTEAVEPIATEWGDENIMNGVVSLVAGRLPKGFDVAELKIFASHTLGRRAFDADSAPIDPAMVKTQSVRATEKTLTTLVARIHEGFFYSPSGISKDEKATRLAAVKTALEPLGHLRSLVGAKAEITHAFNAESDPVRITTYVFANPKTLEMVRFFTVEGTG